MYGVMEVVFVQQSHKCLTNCSAAALIKWLVKVLRRERGICYSSSAGMEGANCKIGG